MKNVTFARRKLCLQYYEHKFKVLRIYVRGTRNVCLWYCEYKKEREIGTFNSR